MKPTHTDRITRDAIPAKTVRLVPYSIKLYISIICIYIIYLEREIDRVGGFDDEYHERKQRDERTQSRGSDKESDFFS